MKIKPTKSIALFGGGIIKTNTALCAADFDALSNALYDTGGIGLLGGDDTVEFVFVVRYQRDRPATIEIVDVINQRYRCRQNGNINIAFGGSFIGYVDNIVRAGGGTASFRFFGENKGCFMLNGEVFAAQKDI